MPSISPPQRFPCGKRKRPETASQRQNRRNAARVEAETALVMLQPHRRQFGAKADSPLAANAIGRFVLRHRLRTEIADAAMTYGSLRKKYAGVMGAPICEGSEGTGNDTPFSAIRVWRKQIDECEAALLDGGGRDGADIAKRLAFDDIDLEPRTKKALAATIDALLALAERMGKIEIREKRR